MADLPVSQDDPRLEGWYHTIELGGGLVSKGFYDLRSVVDKYGIPDSLKGKEVLEVATADGFFALEMERRGAKRVVAVDLPVMRDCDWVPRMKDRLGEIGEGASWPYRFRMAHAMRRSKIDYRHCSVYDLSPYNVGTFDIVFCGSLLLHLQNPLGALIAIRSVTREFAIIETAIDPEWDEKYPGRALMTFGFPGEEKVQGEKNSYWVMSSAGLEKMIRYAGFDRVERQGTFVLPPHTAITACAMRAYPHG